jgi:hypothetical protein
VGALLAARAAGARACDLRSAEDEDLTEMTDLVKHDSRSLDKIQSRRLPGDSQ